MHFYLIFSPFHSIEVKRTSNFVMHPRYSPIASPHQQQPQQQMGETHHQTVRQGIAHCSAGIRLPQQYRPQIQRTQNYINVSMLLIRINYILVNLRYIFI